MVERDGEALTKLDDSFWPQRVITIHWKWDEEIRVTQMYVRAYLLQSRCRPEDTQDGKLMRCCTRWNGRGEVRGIVELLQGRDGRGHCRGDMGDPEAEDGCLRIELCFHLDAIYVLYDP